MGFLGMSGKTWKRIGKVALKAAPIVAAPFTGGASLLALGAGAGALSGALDGGGWKGALMGGALGAIPGGGAGGAAAGGVAKAGLKEVAKGVAKGAATNFAAGTASGLVTGQGLKNSLVGGAQAAGAGGMGTGGLAQAAKTVGKNVAVNAGGHYAAQGLQKAGLPGAVAQQGGNVFSQYLGNQMNKPGATGTPAGGAGVGASARPQGAGGIDFNTFVPGGGAPTGTAPGGVNWKGAATAGLGALATGVANRATSGGSGGQIPSGTNPIPTSIPGGPTQQIPRGNNPIPTSTGQIPRVTGQAPQVQAPADATTSADPNAPKPASFGERYGSVIAQAGGLAAGAYAGKKATEMAQKRSPEEQAALTGAQGAAGQLGTGGQQAWQRGTDLQQAPGQYFQTLLSGNRAAMSQAIAGPAAQITGNYRGAQRALDQQGVRGAARDVAVGDLNRDRVSKIAGLTTGMQPYAAEQLTSMGQQQQALAPGMLGAAGSLHSGLLGQGAGNREYARREGGETAKAIGGLAREVGEVAFKRPQGGVATTPETKPQPPAQQQQGGASTPPPVMPVQAPPYKRPVPATGYPSTNIPAPTFGGPIPRVKNDPWANVRF